MGFHKTWYKRRFILHYATSVTTNSRPLIPQTWRLNKNRHQAAAAVCLPTAQQNIQQCSGIVYHDNRTVSFIVIREIFT